MGRATPEEAALGDVPAKYVRVIATVVRGDRAVVAQLMNDEPPYEVETAECSQLANGTWEAGSSGNSTIGFLPTGEHVGTYVAWDEAAEGAEAARFVCQGVEQVVPVQEGCVVAIFDDVSVRDEVSVLFDGPRLSSWIAEDGTEQQLPMYEPPDWLRERMRKRIETGYEGPAPPGINLLESDSD